ILDSSKISPFSDTYQFEESNYLSNCKGDERLLTDFKIKNMLLVTVSCLTVLLSIFSLNQSVSAGQEQSSLPGLLVDSEMIDIMKERIDNKEEPTYSAWQKVLDSAEKRLKQEPSAPKHWSVPGFYDDPAGHRAAKASVMDDSNGAYD